MSQTQTFSLVTTMKIVRPCYGRPGIFPLNTVFVVVVVSNKRGKVFGEKNPHGKSELMNAS